MGQLDLGIGGDAAGRQLSYLAQELARLLITGSSLPQQVGDGGLGFARGIGIGVRLQHGPVGGGRVAGAAGISVAISDAQPGTRGESPLREARQDGRVARDRLVWLAGGAQRIPGPVERFLCQVSMLALDNALIGLQCRGVLLQAIARSGGQEVGLRAFAARRLREGGALRGGGQHRAIILCVQCGVGASEHGGQA